MFSTNLLDGFICWTVLSTIVVQQLPFVVQVHICWTVLYLVGQILDLLDGFCWLLGSFDFSFGVAIKMFRRNLDLPESCIKLRESL